MRKAHSHRHKIPLSAYRRDPIILIHLILLHVGSDMERPPFIPSFGVILLGIKRLALNFNRGIGNGIDSRVPCQRNDAEADDIVVLFIIIVS